ncbi:ubiquitin carboxyl-terminal hydrolase [Armillaria borealis]|uniref:Ubiquitin carboxyl-terminal hydrolase n=1 Tax=Armillaria borealis TaxID=47425 RepID=A0AA39J904_9AGAR|nr:ubiquitin carboxyl-terminal hydrolase [Armillaria borealis]
MTTLKHFPPLESDQEIFSELLYRLGVDTNLKFIDILSLDIDPDVPRPALALIFICTYNLSPQSDGEVLERVEKSPFDPMVFSVPQSIHHACGLYAILHSVCNGAARKHVRLKIAVFRIYVPTVSIRYWYVPSFFVRLS